MRTHFKAIETTARFDKKNRLILDEPVPISQNQTVRVIIIYPEAEDIEEDEWLYAAAKNPAFDFLKEPGENIYTVDDGKPFDDQG